MHVDPCWEAGHSDSSTLARRPSTKWRSRLTCCDIFWRVTVFRRRAGPGLEAGGERGRARSLRSIFSPVCAKNAAGRREEAPALRTRRRAVGPGWPLGRSRRGAPPASPEHSFWGVSMILREYARGVARSPGCNAPSQLVDTSRHTKKARPSLSAPLNCAICWRDLSA